MRGLLESENSADDDWVVLDVCAISLERSDTSCSAIVKNQKEQLEKNEENLLTIYS